MRKHNKKNDNSVALRYICYKVHSVASVVDKITGFPMACTKKNMIKVGAIKKQKPQYLKISESVAVNITIIVIKYGRQ